MLLLITAELARVQLPGLVGDAEDATILEPLIRHVDMLCARRAGYPGSSPTMVSRTYTLQLRGDNARELDLQVYPAASVTAAAVDPSADFEGNEDTVTVADLVIREGRTARLLSTSSSSWSREERGNRVTFVAGYNGRSTVSGAHASNATTITVASTAAFALDSGLIRVQVGTEIIHATGKTATTLTGCTRGAEGTTAASILTGATITQPTPPGLAHLVAMIVKYFYEQRQTQQISSVTTNGRTVAYQDTTRATGERDLLPDWALAGLGAYLLPSAVA